MKCGKVILIGDIDLHRFPYNGEKMKNQLFLRHFRTIFDKVIPVDVHDWKHRPWCMAVMLWQLLFNRNAKVILSACDEHTYQLIKFLYYVRLKKNVFYWVVGGGFHEKMRRGEFERRYYGFLKMIIVQSPDMVDTLQRLGFSNVMFVPNSKPVYEVTHCGKQGVVRFAFLSRIEPTKGCDHILECVRELNQAGLQSRFEVTFYGKVASDYEADFNRKVEELPNVTYYGILDLTSAGGYGILADNDVFLFPTFYRNEGFPGVLIDAFIAGLPIIASDWHFNSQLIDVGRTGVIIEHDNCAELKNAMESFITSKYYIEDMRRYCIEKAKEYDVRNVLCPQTLERIGLM